jgi:TrmH family RNA methyltransferase
MTRRLLITSGSNERLKAVRRLARRRDRSLFLVEGYRQVRRALEAGAPLREVYVAPSLFLGETDAELVVLAERRGACVVELAPSAFRTISGGMRPDGLVAVAERWTTALGALELGACPLLLVAEGVERPGNLGAIVRTACSAGATALVACDAGTDPFHPDTVRGSVGTLFHLPVAACSSRDAIAWLADRDVAVVVATPDGAHAHWEVDYTRPVALVVGSERHGVSEAWREAADETVSIPMPGPSDSLNVAVAAGVVLFEAARQRLEGGDRPGRVAVCPRSGPVEGA